MQRINRWTLVLLLMIFQAAPVSAGWLWGSGPLVTIDGQQFGKDAVRQWWNLWKEPGWSFPDTAEPFVRWKILADEGRNMGLDQTPEFAHKVEVFLKVRSMMTLKREEIDQKVVVSDKEIQEVYDRDYRPLDNLQILYYDTREKAAAAREGLVPFIGRPAGKLVFADLSGVAKDKGGPVKYHEPSVAPIKMAAQDAIWKQEVDKLKPGGISEVFANNKVFVLLRLDSVSEPDPADFSKHRKTIKYRLWRKKEAGLTNALLNSLAKKYGLKVDKKVMAAITRDRKDYDKEFLARTVARIRDIKIPAAKLVESIRRERKLRTTKKYSSEDFENLKKLALNSMYSQTMIIWEAMNRHYEQRQPLKSQLAFYMESQLNNAVKARLGKKAKVSDAEVEKYYQEHKEEYTRPDTMVYSEVTADKELMDKAWAEVISGKDFFETVRQIFHYDAAVNYSRVIDLSGEKLRQLQSLAEGEVSHPFLYNDKYLMVKLINRKAKKYIPFAQVAAKIRRKMQAARFSREFEDFIKRLKAGRDIKVDNKAWTAFKAELEA